MDYVMGKRPCNFFPAVNGIETSTAIVFRCGCQGCISIGKKCDTVLQSDAFPYNEVHVFVGGGKRHITPGGERLAFGATESV